MEDVSCGMQASEEEDSDDQLSKKEEEGYGGLVEHPFIPSSAVSLWQQDATRKTYAMTI